MGTAKMARRHILPFREWWLNCPFCEGKESTKHVLFQCPAHASDRQSLMDCVDKHTSLDDWRRIPDWIPRKPLTREDLETNMCCMEKKESLWLLMKSIDDQIAEDEAAYRERLGAYENTKDVVSSVTPSSPIENNRSQDGPEKETRPLTLEEAKDRLRSILSETRNGVSAGLPVGSLAPGAGRKTAMVPPTRKLAVDQLRSLQNIAARRAMRLREVTPRGGQAKRYA
jgi:hypothetical protein